MYDNKKKHREKNMEESYFFSIHLEVLLIVTKLLSINTEIIWSYEVTIQTTHENLSSSTFLFSSSTMKRIPSECKLSSNFKLKYAF